MDTPAKNSCRAKELETLGRAWSVFMDYLVQHPIALTFHGDKNETTESERRASYWLVFCKCGSWAEIVGQALKKDERICSKCRNHVRKIGQRQIQIDKKSQVAHPSSCAPYSSLTTPVKVERYKNVRKLVYGEKRRNAHLEEDLSQNQAKSSTARMKMLMNLAMWHRNSFVRTQMI
jgi:hypothetical protein